MKWNQHRYVYVKSTSWFWDTQGLFDYDAFSYVDSEAFVQDSCFINLTSTDQIQVSKWDLNQYPISNQRFQTKTLISLAKIDGEYYVYHWQNPKSIDHKERVYEVAKYSKDWGVLLTKGLILKFGRI